MPSRHTLDEVREFSAKCATYAAEATRRAINMARVEGYDPDEREKCYNMYRGMALEDAILFAKSLVSAVHFTDKQIIQPRILSEMKLLASHMTMVVKGFEERQAVGRNI